MMQHLMARDASKEARPSANHAMSRRGLGKIVLLGMFVGGYYYVTGRNAVQNTSGNPNIIDPDRDLAALAAANQGKSVIGNAPGHYPERVISLARGATNLIVVTYSGTDIASIGTTWKAQLGKKADGSEITLATARHVLTDHGRHSLTDIASIWIGHPSFSDSFSPLDLSAARVELAASALPSSTAGDAGVIRMPAHAAPRQLANAPALRLAAPNDAQPGTPLLVTGVPAVFVPQFSASGVEATPLYAQVMPPMHNSAVPDGCFGLRGLSGAGVSGASALNAAGEVVGMVVDYVSADPDTTVAIQVDALRRLA